MPSTNGINFYYPNSSTHVLYPVPNHLFPNTTNGYPQFAKRDTSMFLTTQDTDVAAPRNRILEFNAASGIQLNNYNTIENFYVLQMSLTATRLYCLVTEDGVGDSQAIKKLKRSDGTLDATFKIDNINPNNMFVVNDNLIYILCNGSPAALYYLKNFTDLIFVGYTAGQGITPFAFGTGQFAGGAFYYGANGFAGFTPNIFKITVACPAGSPPTPIIASANRGAGSVVAGATITASWADVLVPNAADAIQLHTAPTGGALGFTASSLINSQPTDGLGTSSIVYTIPGGTPPGTYVFMYAALGNTGLIYVATSPTFTVT